MKTKNKAARGGEMPAQFSTLYVVTDDSTGRVLTKPMGWNPASDWAASPLTKGAYPGGVTVVPAAASAIPAALLAALPVGWTLDGGTLNHGALSSWVGLGCGVDVCLNVARELRRNLHTGMADRWEAWGIKLNAPAVGYDTRLDDEESECTLDCGCRMWRDGEGFCLKQCALHAQASEMLEFVERLAVGRLVSKLDTEGALELKAEAQALLNPIRAAGRERGAPCAAPAGLAAVVAEVAADESSEIALAHRALSEALEDQDGGNDEVRSAAVDVCDALNALQVRAGAALAPLASEDWGHEVSALARLWLAEHVQVWGACSDHELASALDARVQSAIDLHYPGGVLAFLSPAPLSTVALNVG